MKNWILTQLPAILVALVAGGGLAAVIGWRKPQAEADKIKAEAEELVWGHMKETIERLQSDVEELKSGRNSRDEQIAMLTKANIDCLAREKGLVRRIARLEKQLRAIASK